MDAWVGSSCAPAWTPGSSCRSGRCSASSAARPAGGPWPSADARVEFRRLAGPAGIPRRFAHIGCATPTPLSSRARVPLNVIQRKFGHANLGTTSIYLQGVDTGEIIATVHARRRP
jgi:hypothetical protein